MWPHEWLLAILLFLYFSLLEVRVAHVAYITNTFVVFNSDIMEWLKLLNPKLVCEISMCKAQESDFHGCEARTLVSIFFHKSHKPYFFSPSALHHPTWDCYGINIISHIHLIKKIADLPMTICILTPNTKRKNKKKEKHQASTYSWRIQKLFGFSLVIHQLIFSKVYFVP